jgi:competence protein ComFC
MLSDFLSLLYPRNCISCGNSLYKHEEEVCNYCILNLPKANFLNSIHNPLEQVFYGRLNLVCASSYYLFTKKGGVQKLLHAIKYKGNKNLAFMIGKWFAEDIKNNELIQTIDYIVPVPLHPKKLKSRGYNQSEEFAKGLAFGLNISLNTTVLMRTSNTSTQTKKTKFERWENVGEEFMIQNQDELVNKHIVIVDDVVTTGATIEACGLQLQKIPGVKLSVLSIAYAAK